MWHAKKNKWSIRLMQRILPASSIHFIFSFLVSSFKKCLFQMNDDLKYKASTWHLKFHSKQHEYGDVIKSASAFRVPHCVVRNIHKRNDSFGQRSGIRSNDCEGLTEIVSFQFGISVKQFTRRWIPLACLCVRLN